MSKSKTAEYITCVIILFYLYSKATTLNANAAQHERQHNHANFQYLMLKVVHYKAS